MTSPPAGKGRSAKQLAQPPRRAEEPNLRSSPKLPSPVVMVRPVRMKTPAEDAGPTLGAKCRGIVTAYAIGWLTKGLPRDLTAVSGSGYGHERHGDDPVRGPPGGSLIINQRRGLPSRLPFTAHMVQVVKDMNKRHPMFTRINSSAVVWLRQMKMKVMGDQEVAGLNGLGSPVSCHKIPTVQELNGKPYRKWHNTFTHATNDCRVASASPNGDRTRGG
ncbi:hypothetical protein QYE76_000651 [Lolium multiflorum]|uniref:Uncharacterized protein n=1 Tax=Lolium multiflorum TaxID=4521 RepID=A0AAD8RMA1_LOLMU|nr:hypothetical protein QYE76_000651 [Lolium multiflorum]